MGVVIAIIAILAVLGLCILLGSRLFNLKGHDDRPLGDTPEAHDEINPHDVPKWDRATRMTAEEQSGGLEGTTGGNEEGEAGGRALSRGGRAEPDG